MAADIMAGVRVLEVASLVFVPGASAMLADWGADVIKIEHPLRGDMLRGLTSSAIGLDRSAQVNFMFEQVNRGKRSVGLDIGSDGGRELLYRIAETADVFLTNMLPDVRRRYQIDVEDLRARNPNIIYVRGSGYGPRGPDADKQAVDGGAYWARGGMGQVLAPPDQEWPVQQRPGLGDFPSATVVAAGVAAALFHRQRTGLASVVDVSLLGCAMWTLAPDITAGGLVGNEIMSFDRSESPNPLVNAYRTSDGRFLSLMMIHSDKCWTDLCHRLGRSELAEDPRFADSDKRFEHRRECVAALDKVFATRPLAEWRQVLDGVDGIWDFYQTPRELLDDPQAKANDYLPTLESASGIPFTLVANPVQIDETPVALTVAPEHGQHTEELLLECGLSWDEIIEHKQSGAIR